MKNFKKYLKLVNLLPVFIMITMIISACGSSQTTQETPDSTKQANKEQRMQEREQLLNNLNLTPDQKVEVGAILKENQEQMQSLRNNNMDRRDKIQNMRNLMQETDEKLSKILDSEQMEIYQAFKERQREQMREQMGNRRRR